MSRDAKIEVRITEKEAAVLRGRCQAQECSLSDLVRDSLGLPRMQRQPQESHGLLTHFRRQNAKRNVEPGVAALDRIARRG